MTDILGDAILVAMGLRAIQVATLKAALRRIDEHTVRVGATGAIVAPGLTLATTAIQSLIEEIEGETHV